MSHELGINSAMGVSRQGCQVRHPLTTAPRLPLNLLIWVFGSHLDFFLYRLRTFICFLLFVFSGPYLAK